ncbi:MAG: site-specific DNA-methyltransferase [Deltaproteobacteria bacterium]|nr:site-specific DNA-methyltransferase [Deltaproteobacteria bacterium]
MTKEQKFYEALRDVFIGAKIEGEGGFINLMRMKSAYYSQIEKLLKEDVEKALIKHSKFRDELFDKLYTFFSRYFTENGSIYFNSTPFHNNIYEKVYTDEKDVILFWKTQMLYYVKTDRIFRSMPVEFDGLKCYFDASQIENKKANEKRTLIFELSEIREDGAIVFNVKYSERGTKTKTDEILKNLKKKNTGINEELLEKAFRIFEKQSEVDFFINKNAKEFLREQFKLWSYQYFWDGAKEWPEGRVNELQILKDIAFKIIDFVSQFEDELVKIWNKPKFVKNSNYVITLDKILDKKLIEKIKKHKNYPLQIKEWEELGINKDNPKAPIDTRYFKDLELEILGLFNDLDNQLDGWLIKSENYQALNTILPKFKEKVQAIYIDPPFNLDSSDQFLYRTNYKDANWATLLENRLKLAKNILDEKGSIFVRCDYNGNWIVRCLMDNIFFKDNFRNEIIVKRTRTLKGESKRFATSQDTLFFYANSIDKLDFFGFRTLKPEKEWQWVDMHLPGTRKDEDLLWRNFFGKDIKAPEGRRWTLSQEALENAISQGLVKMDEKSGMPKFLTKYETLGTDWLDISGYSQTWDFTTENSEVLLNRVIKSVTKNSDFIFDFFAGSGTTTAVAHKLGRKWIGVEMGEHFYSVVLPRMKKALAYDKSGISKDIKEYQGGGFFKYYELEQYEEALANCKYGDGDMFTSPSKTPYQEYVFMKDEKLLSTLEIDYENSKVNIDLSKLYPDIDIAETLSNLTGKWIKAIKDVKVEFTDGSKIDTTNLDYKLIKPLIWWE